MFADFMVLINWILNTEWGIHWIIPYDKRSKYLNPLQIIQAEEIHPHPMKVDGKLTWDEASAPISSLENLKRGYLIVRSKKFYFNLFY